MDFSNRNTQPAAAPAPSTGGHAPKRKFRPNTETKAGRVLIVLFAAAVAIILIACTLILTMSQGNNESKLVNNSKLQAVFLNTGQVYFGNINELNSKFIVLSNIYYLQTANNNGGSNNASNVTLVKLGCELHQPYDKMVINRDQVTFWENLQDNGQVAKAVNTFVKQNPNGQKCVDQSNSSSNNGSNVQKAGQSGSNNP